MSQTFDAVIGLVGRGDVKVSEHGYDRLSMEHILVRDIVDGVGRAVIIEDYPEYPKGPCVLVLQRSRDGSPIHVVWGIPQGAVRPAVVVTAYRPEPELWSDDFTRRKR